MGFIRNFLSSLIILLAIPLLLIGTLSFIAKRTILSEDFVKTKIEENKIYDGLTGFASNSLKDQAEDERLEPVIDRAVTVDRVRTAVEPALTELFRFLKSKTNEVAIVVDLRPIKNDIRQNISKSKLEELDDLMPDELRAENQSVEGNREPTRLENLKGWYQRLNQWAYLLPFVVLGLLVTLFLINHGRSRLRRPAYVFLIDGLILSIIGAIATVGIPYAIKRLGSNPAFPEVVNETLANISNSVGGEIARLILLFGFGFLFVAVALFVASFFLHQPVLEAGEDKSYDPKRGRVKH